MDSQIEVLGFLQNVAGFLECFRCNGVQHYIACGNGILGANHTELEFVSGKSKWGSTVAICGILHKIRKGLNACSKLLASLASCCSSGADQLLQHVLKLFSKEYRDNSRRSLMSSKTLVVSNICCGLTKKICMLVNCL